MPICWPNPNFGFLWAFVLQYRVFWETLMPISPHQAKPKFRFFMSICVQTPCPPEDINAHLLADFDGQTEGRSATG